MNKLSLGCGNNKPEGFVGADKFKSPGVDILIDLDRAEWEGLRTSYFDEIEAIHILEHLTNLCAAMKEIYRISKNGAMIRIAVPSPSHDDFHIDPTHKTSIMPDTFALFSKKINKLYREQHAANTPLADQLNVDFDVISAESIIDPRYETYLNEGGFILEKLMRENRNVVKEYRIILKVVKDEDQ